MIERIEKIENELKVIRNYFESTMQFIESEKEKTEALALMNSTIGALFGHVKDFDKKIIELEDSYVLLSKNKALHFQIIESQGRTIKTLIETLESHQKILNTI